MTTTQLLHLSNEAYLRGDEKRSWLLFYKAQLAAGDVCPECDAPTSEIEGTRDFFICLTCEHSWSGEEVTP